MSGIDAIARQERGTAAAEMGSYARSLRAGAMRAYALAYAEYLLGLRGEPPASSRQATLAAAEQTVRARLGGIQGAHEAPRPVLSVDVIYARNLKPGDLYAGIVTRDAPTRPVQ